LGENSSIVFDLVSTNYPILLVEDDKNDQFLMERSFKALGKKNPVYIVSDGREALDYLEARGKFADRATFPLPRLILMDLKMPRMTGFEVLEWLRDQAEYRRIPVIIISSSSIVTDVNKAYELGASAYMIKPVGSDALKRLVNTITEFWGEPTAKPT
jgi:CheY-like chemotaxis protein